LKEIAQKSKVNINSGTSINSNVASSTLNHTHSRNNTGGVNFMSSNLMTMQNVIQAPQAMSNILHNQTVHEVPNQKVQNTHNVQNIQNIQNVQINLHTKNTNQKEPFNMMKTYSSGQHVKSNSMSYNNNPGANGVPVNLGNYLHVYNKKVQPKIIKNAISKINPLQSKEILY
jgi:hypothetical protein